jgi:predicted small lipoprotein YifL
MHTSWPASRILPLVLVALLSACGQKGALYKPDERAQEVDAQESSTSDRKKSGPKIPAPQTQKEERKTPAAPGDPISAPPTADSDRPSSPPPPSN